MVHMWPFGPHVYQWAMWPFRATWPTVGVCIGPLGQCTHLHMQLALRANCMCYLAGIGPLGQCPLVCTIGPLGQLCTLCGPIGPLGQLGHMNKGHIGQCWWDSHCGPPNCSGIPIKFHCKNASPKIRQRLYRV